MLDPSRRHPGMCMRFPGSCACPNRGQDDINVQVSRGGLQNRLTSNVSQPLTNFCREGNGIVRPYQTACITALVFSATFLSCRDLLDTDPNQHPLRTSVTPEGVDLGTFGGLYSAAHAINNSGVIVGESTNEDERLEAFIWTASSGMQRLLPAGTSGRANAINQIGTIVGDTGLYVGQMVPFRQTAGGITFLELPPGGEGASAYAVNLHNVVVGSAYGSFGTAAVMWQSASPTFLGSLGQDQSVAVGINDFGVVVGVAADPNWAGRPFRWTASQGMQQLPMVSGHAYAGALAINSQGEIAGYTVSQTGLQHAVVWDASDGTPTVLPPLPDYTLDPGQVVITGDGDVFAGFHSSGNWVIAWYRVRTEPPVIIAHDAVIHSINSHGRIAGARPLNPGTRAAYWDFEPPGSAGLQCTTVTRGQLAVCKIREPVDSVVGWSFTTLLPFSGDPYQVDTLLSALEWSGISAWNRFRKHYPRRNPSDPY